MDRSDEFRSDMRHGICVHIGMISNTSIRRIHPDAPSIVHELRGAFDEHFMDLYKVARDQASRHEHRTSSVLHVDFPLGALHATAMYNVQLDRFTQVVARAADEAHHERPNFTISVFLEEIDPE